MLIFIDTEFTDFFDPKLISIGMVADSGEEFYAEVLFPDAACSAFAREAVIPLLKPISACVLPDNGLGYAYYVLAENRAPQWRAHRNLH